MQKREAEAASPRREHIYVPFSWEEKPGVPKEDPSMSLHADSYQLIPLQPPNQYTHSPLLKPPCLQPFPPCTQPHHSSSPKILVRKHSFNNITSTTTIKPLSRKYSHGNLQHRPISSGHHAAASKMEDDPFFMAIQACRKGTYTFQEKPIKLFYHNSNARCGEGVDVSVRRRQNGSEVEDFKHLTIRQLFTQQLQEEEEQLKRGQRQPLINVSTSQRKPSRGPLSIFARCFGFY